MRFRTRLHILFILTALTIAGCTDDPLPGEGTALSPETDMSRFWYSRSRSAQENGVMMRHHALGFSYQAVSGEKCNIGDVMCQVLNLDYLDENGLCFRNDESETVGSSYVQRGIADYVHGTSWQTSLSTDLVLYQGERRKQHFLIETINDSTLIMNNTLGLRTNQLSIRLDLLLDTKDLPGELSEHPDEVLSENFRYALSKLKADRENVAVIDSFINIFGTHVVTRVDVGGTCNLSVKTSKRFVSTYLEEQEYSKDAVNLFFKKMESVEKLSNQTSYKNLFKTAEIDLKVRGGDLSHFDRLIANPSFDNAQASYQNFDAWATSLAQSVGKGWDEGAELIDMAVTPIYEFIPDEDLAKRVKVRMEASVQAMRDLYGERNFTSAALNVHTAWDWHIDYYPVSLAKYEAKNEYIKGFCHAIADELGPSRIVAVTYEEYIPELIDRLYPHYDRVVVTYPIYENRIQMTEGIAMIEGCIYSVKWLYDRFVVKDMGLRYPVGTVVPLYLYKGRLFMDRPEADDRFFHQTETMPDYAWSKSIGWEGEVNVKWDVVHFVFKVFDKFYMPYDEYEIILPGWHFNRDQSLLTDYYKNSGIIDFDRFKERSLLGECGTKTRMVRNDNYRYQIIPKELYKR